MNKQQFLDELRSKLVGLPDEEIENRVSFYEEMINDRIDEGKSEEEAINEIGTVDEVVREIAKDTPLVSLVKHKMKPKRRLRRLGSIDYHLLIPILASTCDYRYCINVCRNRRDVEWCNCRLLN